MNMELTPPLSSDHFFFNSCCDQGKVKDEEHNSCNLWLSDFIVKQRMTSTENHLPIYPCNTMHEFFYTDKRRLFLHQTDWISHVFRSWAVLLFSPFFLVERSLLVFICRLCFLFSMLLSDAKVQNHMSHYLRKAYDLRHEVDHMLQVCLLFVQCKEVCFKVNKVERTSFIWCWQINVKSQFWLRINTPFWRISASYWRSLIHPFIHSLTHSLMHWLTNAIKTKIKINFQARLSQMELPKKTIE